MAIFDGNLKQRLIGVVVLVILAVVFLPMIFNNKGEKLPETIVTIPLEPKKPIQPSNQSQSTVITTNNQPTTPSQVAQDTQPPADNAPATSTTVSAKPQPNEKNITNQALTTTQPTTQNITATWNIQVAAVSNLQNAEAFTNKLRKANYNAHTRTEGNIHRVFVGPFIEKEEASRVQKLIEKQFKEKGIIREFKPERK